MTHSTLQIRAGQCVTQTDMEITTGECITGCGCSRCRQQRLRARRAAQLGLCHHCGALVQCNSRGTLRRHRRTLIDRSGITDRVCPGTATDGSCTGAEVLELRAVTP